MADDPDMNINSGDSENLDNAMRQQPGGGIDVLGSDSALEEKKDVGEEGSDVEVIDDQPSCKKQRTEVTTDVPTAMDDHDPDLEDTDSSEIDIVGQSKSGGQVSNAAAEEKEEIDRNENTEAALVPESFRDNFVLMQGRNPVMVVEKNLAKKDLSWINGQRRLHIPKSANEFLKDYEKELLNMKGEDNKPYNKIDTTFLDMKGNRFTVQIFRPRRGDGYILTDPWVNLAAHVDKNIVNNRVQLWAFRIEEGDRLCFALVSKEIQIPPQQD